MLPKSLRIPRRVISDVLRKGRRHAHPHVTLVLLPNNETVSRFACIISAKAEPQAVRRNRMRRVIYETIRMHIDEIKKGLHVIFVLKKSAFSLQKDDLPRIVLEALSIIESRIKN